MKYTSGTTGRVFVLQFEDGDQIYKEIENLAQTQQISSGVVWIIGGVKNGGIVVGPRNIDEMPPHPVVENFDQPYEIAGIGTLFNNEHGKIRLHLHASLGRGRQPLVGCPRISLDCWLITEAIILELKEINAARLKDDISGFELLRILGK